MPALSSPQLTLLRRQSQSSNWYCVPIPPVTVFAAQINDPSITVGAVTITFDNVTSGAFGNVLQGATVLVGSAPGLSDYGVLRERLPADATHLYVAWNSDIAWADNLYLTVYQQYLAWSVRQRIVPPTIYKDYNIAYSDQTEQWPPVALMGDNVCKLWAGNPTAVYFDGTGSYAVDAGATIASYAWAFGDGGTSTAATPGNHNYTAAGTYYATLTVTDSNGKTHLTRRIIALPDPASIYTVKLELTSLEGVIENGWNAKVRVFDPNATIADFPERAPCFLISTDSYGGTVGSVGFPTGREDVVFFGYIVADSVAIQPEYNEVAFELESIAGVMERTDSPPVYLGDSADPSAEPDAWAWGEDLDVFRGLVYLLRFHSTIMDIADVHLYRDTTLTKAVDYPQDNLWNMLTQFAKGKRLLRTGVTRTGGVYVTRDPNLTPVASRSAYTTVFTMVQGDWREQVTAPQKPYPETSFICISGLTYDGDPSHEPNPVFGMSPGRPPKDYGSEREIQYLKLVDQTEANTLAGLLLGTDNLPYGEIVIPLRGNWVKCFEPALQEYVQTPSGGWVTKRGTILDSVKLIVRKVSVAFDWDAGTMMPTLSCEYPSVNEIAVNGDCFPPDAPPPPAPAIPPIIPPPHPVPTNGANLDVWTLFDTGDIYKLTVVAPNSGTVASKPSWKNFYGTGNLITPRDPRDIAPSLGLLLNILSTYHNLSTGLTDAQVQHSSNDAGAYTTLGVNTSIATALMRRDPQSDNVLWVLVIEPSDGDALKAPILAATGGPQYDNTTIISHGLTDYKANTGAIRLYRSTNGGASWATGLFLDYLNQLWATQMVGDSTLTTVPYPNPPHDPDPPFSGQTFNINYLPQAPDDLGDGANIWTSRFTTDDTWSGSNWVGWDARLGGATVGVNSLSGSPQDPLGYWLYHAANIAQYASFLSPSVNALLAPNGYGTHVYVLISGYQVSVDLEVDLAGILCELKLNPMIQNPSLAIPFLWPGDWNYEEFYTYAYKVPTSGAVTSSRQAAQSEFSGSAGKDKTAHACADLLVADFVYTLTDAHYWTRWSYVVIVISFTYANAAARLASVHGGGDVGLFAFQTDTATVWKLTAAPSTWEYINGAPVDLAALFGSVPIDVFCTTQGTVLIGTADGHVHRTTDRGQNWTDVTITGIGAFGTFFATESHGVIGGRVGPIVVPIGTSGKYVYSLDDGASWRVTADLTAHATVLSNYAR